MTAITIVLAAIAATLAAGVWVLHHHLRRIAAALQPPTAEPLGIDVDRLHEWQGRRRDVARRLRRARRLGHRHGKDTVMSDLDLDGIEKRAEAAHQHVVKLCSGEERWTMRVPAQPDRDSDLVIDDSLKDIPALVAEVRRLVTRCDDAGEEIAFLRGERARLRAEADAHEGEVGDLRAKLTAAETELDEERRVSDECTAAWNVERGRLEDNLATLVAEVRRLRGELTEQGDRLRETLAKRDELRERLEYAQEAEAELKQSVAARDRLLSAATTDRDRLRADLEQASQSLAVSYERLDRLTDPARDRKVAAATLWWASGYIGGAVADHRTLSHWSRRVAAGELKMPCPTCSGPTRETVGLVCQDCGTDYGPLEVPS